MDTRKWEPPGTTPCCGKMGLLPVTWALALLFTTRPARWLYPRARAIVLRPWWCENPPWPQG